MMSSYKDWPSSDDCYDAMSKFVEYYMEDEQKFKWEMLIKEFKESSRSPPGKGFLHEIDQILQATNKPSMPKRAELYQLICSVCI